MNRSRVIFVVAVAAITGAPVGVSVVDADEAASLAGTVVDAAGDPVPDAEVSLPELRRTILTDENGRFTFVGLPPGEYLLSVSSARAGGAAAPCRLR